MRPDHLAARWLRFLMNPPERERRDFQCPECEVADHTLPAKFSPSSAKVQSTKYYGLAVTSGGQPRLALCSRASLLLWWARLGSEACAPGAPACTR